MGAPGACCGKLLILNTKQEEARETVLTLPDVVEVDVGEEAVHADALVLESALCVRQQTLDQVHRARGHLRLSRELQAFLRQPITSLDKKMNANQSQVQTRR